MASGRRKRRYLGIREGDLAGKSYARFWKPVVSRMSDEVDKVKSGSSPESCFYPFTNAASMFELRRFSPENAFCVAADGSVRVNCRTWMPGVSPEMIDWWFGWHSDEPERYKLWHPQAHVHAEWHTPPPAGATGRARYVGRTSYVDEYIGRRLGSYAIRFVPPESLGFDAMLLADPREATAVCARIGFARIPLDFGWLVHYVTRTDAGCEMRSRFWVGGPHTALRTGGRLGGAASRLIRRVAAPKEENARELLTHCSQEMSHLATFLPGLFAELGTE